MARRESRGDHDGVRQTTDLRATVAGEATTGSIGTPADVRPNLHGERPEAGGRPEKITANSAMAYQTVPVTYAQPTLGKQRRAADSRCWSGPALVSGVHEHVEQDRAVGQRR
jgi:hypothetical protein